MLKFVYVCSNCNVSTVSLFHGPWSFELSFWILRYDKEVSQCIRTEDNFGKDKSLDRKKNEGNIALGTKINEPQQVQREDNFVKEWGLIFITCNDSSSIGRNMVAKF